MFIALFLGIDNSANVPEVKYTTYYQISQMHLLSWYSKLFREIPLLTANEYMPSELQEISSMFMIHYSKPEVT